MYSIYNNQMKPSYEREMLFPIILGCIQYTHYHQVMNMRFLVISHYLGMYSIYLVDQTIFPVDNRYFPLSWDVFNIHRCRLLLLDIWFILLFPIILGCIQYTEYVMSITKEEPELFPIILGCIQYTV